MKKVALCIGHNKSSQGARTKNLISEYAFFYTYLHTIRKDVSELTGLDIDVLQREPFDDLEGVVSKINDGSYDLCIEFHFNSFRLESAGGYEVLTSGSRLSSMFADIFIDHYSIVSSRRNRGSKVVKKGGSGGYFLNMTNPPAVLLEPFFGSNKDETIEFMNNISIFTDTLIKSINSFKSITASENW